MFSAIKHNTPPESLKEKKYDGSDVHDKLNEDFYGKCYICGGEVVDREVEHFIPHADHDNLKFGWDNLLLACGYCNNRKSNSYNSKGKNLLNPILTNIENQLEHNISPFRGCEPSFKNLTGSKEVDNTIELLNKVFTKKGALIRENKIKDSVYSSRQELENRKKSDEVIEEIIRLQEDYHQYLLIKDDPSDLDYKPYIRRLAKHFNRSSSFYEFKVSFLKYNPSMKKDIESILHTECTRKVEYKKGEKSSYS